MITLDCESYESTFKSLIDIYGIDDSVLEGFFESFDIEDHYERNDPDRMGDEELRVIFEAKNGLQPNILNKVCWFHLTRALPEEDFKEGILPLTRSLDKVWEVFFTVFRDTDHFNNLKTMKSSSVDDFQFNHKAGVDLHGGPYAMLVRDVAFKSKDIGNHDYLGMPEILEDICNGYEKSYGDSITGDLRDLLQPKIVKFISDRKTGVSCIEAALYYAYRTYNNHNLSLNANTCFDGDNQAIPFDEDYA